MNQHNNFFEEQQGETPLKWYQKIILIITAPIAIGLITTISAQNSKREEMKKRLKYFSPNIKRNFFGNEYIEWIGRDKPLTEEELKELL